MSQNRKRTIGCEGHSQESNKVLESYVSCRLAGGVGCNRVVRSYHTVVTARRTIGLCSKDLSAVLYSNTKLSMLVLSYLLYMYIVHESTCTCA